MENAVDALKMAFGVIVFVLALSISIISFGQAKETAQYLIEMEDRESEAAFNSENYYVQQGKTSRVVGPETIIPTLYRAYHEEYIVAFEWKDDSTYVWETWNEDGINSNYKPTNIIDLSKLTVGGEARAIELVSDLISGNKILRPDETNPNVSYYGRDFKSINNDTTNPQKLFDLIENAKFTETQGIYYDEDTWNNGQGTETPEINKNRKRIITYTEKY